MNEGEIEARCTLYGIRFGESTDTIIQRMDFERLASDPSFKFDRSRRNNYVNPAVARDWKWFQLGAIHQQKKDKA